MTDEEILTLKGKIFEAETAYHKLMLGLLPRVFVDQNGERVEFTTATRGGLYNYIASLKALLPGAEAVAQYGRPIRYLFG